MHSKRYKRNHTLLTIFIILGGIFFGTVSAQEAEIMLVRAAPGFEEGIRITDMEGLIIFDDRITPFKDTVWIIAEEHKRYWLEINDMKKSGTDSLFMKLFVNNIPVILIHGNVETGDHRWSFFSGMDKPVLRIVGGTTVSIEDYPWQVFVRAGNYLCGGTIIADKWVLTAAHCLFDEEGNRIPDENIYFRAGANEPYLPFPDGKRYDIVHSVIHEDYNPDNYDNDLALVRTVDVINNSFSKPINLIEEADVENGATDPGKMAVTTGWGLTSVDPEEFPDRLQKIDIPIVSDELARSIWGPISPNMLMAGYVDGRGDACSGDSGGPLIVKVGDEFKLAGIVSWGSSGCDNVGGYVRISEFHSWLRKNTGIGQDQFRTVRAFGVDFRCQDGSIDPSSNIYFSDTITGALLYEWKVEPESAAFISSTGAQAEISWLENFFGEAYISVRAKTSDGITNWAGQRVVTGLGTKIISQPKDITVCTNFDVILNVSATGTDLSFDWLKDGQSIEYGNDSSLVLSAARMEDTGIYSVEISGGCGTITSNPSLVDVLPTTKILNQTYDQTIEQGHTAILEVNAVGDSLGYIWRKDGIVIHEIQENNLYIENIDANAIGLYSVRVEGTCGSKESEEMLVFVNPGISELPDGFNIWPTLTRDIVNIAVNSAMIFDVYIYNSMGIQMGRKLKNRYKTTINLEQFSPDLYFVEIRLDNSSKIFRVIKIS